MTKAKPSAPFIGAAFGRMRADVARTTGGGSVGGGGTNADIVRRIRAALMPPQIAFLDDTHEFISVKCPRRAGKTVALIARAVVTALEIPGARIVLGTMTLKKAKQLFWNGKDGLKKWKTGLPGSSARLWDLGIDFNNSEHKAVFPNGSEIFIYGFETNADVDKVRGEPFHLVILDECYAFPHALLDELVDDAIGPTLGDYAGTLILAGTPGSVFAGTFYLATSPAGCTPKPDEEDGTLISMARPWRECESPAWAGVEWTWSFHEWSTKDNTAHKVKRRVRADDGTITHVNETLWQGFLRKKRRLRWPDNHPTWRREYLGEWVEDASLHVYKYNDERNGWSPRPGVENVTDHLGLPVHHDWHFGLAADLGYDNAFAIQVIAWCDTPLTIAELEVCGVTITPEDREAWVNGWTGFVQVHEFSAPGLTIKSCVSAILLARERIGRDFDFLVGDTGNLGKQIIVSIQEEYGLRIDPAEKAEKDTHIEYVNSELGERRCFVKRNSSLAREMGALTWDVPKGHDVGGPLIRRVENRSCAKDNVDAFRYSVTRAMHRFVRIRPRPPVLTRDQQQRARDDADFKKWQQSARRLKDADQFGLHAEMDTTWELH